MREHNIFKRNTVMGQLGSITMNFNFDILTAINKFLSEEVIYYYYYFEGIICH